MKRILGESRLAVTCAVFFSALCATAHAFINPNFTPVDMVKQSELVLLLEFKSVTPEGIAKAGIAKVLKGATKDKEITLDVMAGTFEDQGKDFISRINGGLKQAMVFIGKMQVEGIDVAGDETSTIGFLHYGDQYSPWRWVCFRKSDANVWNLEKVENYLLGTWAGSTDMLLNAVNYILAEPDPYMPIAANAEWKNKVRIGKFGTKGVLVRPVDLAGNGKPDAFVSSEAGDKLLRFNGKAFDDATAKLALKSASAAYAWGDVDGNGKLDLVSWSGKELSIHSQKADGTFEKKVVTAGAALGSGCASLSVLDLGERGRAVILAGAKGIPALLTPAAAGAVKTEPLAAGALPARDLGAGGACLAADFDGDGVLDVVQLFARGGYFYRGTGKGRFANPVETAAGTGPGKSAACLGDFDGDRLPDIVATAEDKCRIWQNLGGGKFADLLQLSGEIAYISKSDGVDVAVGDVNNDGLQDIFFAYAGIPTQIFFNRGFRSTGHARQLDVNEQLVQESEAGQQSGCLADFNGDGALDLALVLPTGDAWLLPRATDGRALSVTAALALPANGPVKVSAWKDKRCLGSWWLGAGDPGALVGAREVGPLSLQWNSPDGKLVKRDVILRPIPLRVVINK